MESRSSARRDNEQVVGHGGGCQQQAQAQLVMTRPAPQPWSSSSYTYWPAAAQIRSSASCYTCGYCKREFRSAQALGGHMNVHRRERARLRQYHYHYCSAPPPRPPLPNLNLPPAPGPAGNVVIVGGASTTTTPAATVGDDVGDGRRDRPAAIYSFFSEATPTPTPTAATTTMTKAAALLELRVGGFSSDGGGQLDLELRLGCS